MSLDHLQDAIASGAGDDELIQKSTEMKSVNDEYKAQAKHVKLHLPAGPSAGKSKAKAKSRP